LQTTLQKFLCGHRLALVRHRLFLLVMLPVNKTKIWTPTLQNTVVHSRHRLVLIIVLPESTSKIWTTTL
jgi:hypothetical protein